MIGWAFPARATRPHYFAEQLGQIITLCGTFKHTGDLSTLNLDKARNPVYLLAGSLSDCRSCAKKLARLHSL